MPSLAVSTLLEILDRNLLLSKLEVLRDVFQPFLRFWGGQGGGGRRHPHGDLIVSTLLEILAAPFQEPAAYRMQFLFQPFLRFWLCFSRVHEQNRKSGQFQPFLRFWRFPRGLTAYAPGRSFNPS